jgi:hypothetical protein
VHIVDYADHYSSKDVLTHQATCYRVANRTG